MSIYFSLTFRLLLVLLLRSPPPSPSSFPFPSPPSIRPPPSLLSNLRVWLVISIPFPSASLPSLAISIVITPGLGTSLGGSGLGVPRVPPPEPAFPYAPGHLGGLGSAMNPVDPLASPPGARDPVPRVAGVILPAPAWFAGAGGVCRFLPCGSRGWRGVRGLPPSPRSVGCPRGCNWAAALGWTPPSRTPAADSVDILRHLLPSSGVYPVLSLLAP